MTIEPEQAGSLLESLVSLSRTTRIIAHRDAERSVSGTRMALLQVLRNVDPRLGDLATQLRVKPSVASRAAQALEAEGLVARIADPADARACRIHLTDAGRIHLRERQARALRLVSQTFDDFSPEEAEQSIALLRRLESAVVEWVGHLDQAAARGIDPLDSDALLTAEPVAEQPATAHPQLQTTRTAWEKTTA